ncbi:MAG: hypothetical protein ACRENU_04820 [Gemmatimonadaceae bacterium]
MLKPSKELVEHLGDLIAGELVGWFNTMDASQKSELRDINEQNFARFDAKLEQRTGELHAKFERVEASLNAKIDHVEASLNAKIDRVEATLNAKIDRVAAELKEVLERRLGEQIRWLYLTWAVQAAMIMGLYFK